MDGLFFLFGVVAILVIVFWEVRNDKVPPDGPTTGLLAMPDETPPPDPARRSWRRPRREDGDQGAGTA